MDTVSELVGQKLLLAFHGFEQLSPEIVESIGKYKPGGFTLFRSLNIDSLHQVRQLTGSLQTVARDYGLPPLLICADQEGGQLMAVGECTPLPGNMALGATRSVELARQAGVVLGSELAALGINVNYAPCADVNINPKNPVIGTRSFGDAPVLVGALAAAVIDGIQSQGVAATAKHFPGHGDTYTDSHLGLPVLVHDLARLKAVELPPFAAAIKAGVKMIMTAHVGLQALDGSSPPPATLSPHVISSLLRQEMGFTGVVVSDAMDMHAIRQGEALREDVLRAAQAGIDLLLITSDPKDHERAYSSLIHAFQNGQLQKGQLDESVARIMELKNWIASHTTSPDLSVIRCAENLRVADEIAERSITLVRDRANPIPIQLAPEKRIAVVIPEPQDLTPADTSSYIKPGLVEVLKPFHAQVDGFSIPFAPNDDERATIIESLKPYDLIIAGTINACASPNQATFVQQLLNTGIPLIVIAMRLPYDLEVFPQVETYLCTYSILEPAMKAAAKALFGQIQATGKLPVTVKNE
ncbi:MAG TPA: glycoside hydrolase family 3 protein [Bellilinea sp.]|nr:glycoside hydrolase family 3 protein [Bellilinea sp.]